MRALVTGAGGQLGKAMLGCLSDWDVKGFTRAELDITDGRAVTAAVKEMHPDFVINCAAYTDVDGAERDVDAAMRVNGDAVKGLAAACREVGAALVHFSTDYVFDGTKQSAYTIFDDPDPLSVYGTSKLVGERLAILFASPKVFILRTSWLFASDGANFVEKVYQAGTRQGWVKVVSDHRGCPTFADDLAGATRALLSTGRYGLYHVTNQGETTWYDFARAIFEQAGVPVDVHPISSRELGRPARRPENSVLDPYPLTETIGYQLPTWENALSRWLSRRKVSVT